MVTAVAKCWLDNETTATARNEDKRAKSVAGSASSAWSSAVKPHDWQKDPSL